MRRTSTVPVLLAAAMLSLAACAQSPQGPGSGPGSGYGPGPGRMGAGPMMGGRWGPGVTPGWSMMSPAERDEHHRRMAEVRNYDDCRAVMDEHRALMQKRAGDRGVPMRGPGGDPCGGLPR